MTRAPLAAGIVMTLAASGPALAQGNGKAKNAAPPSRNELAPAATLAPSSPAATPLAWVDDASVLPAGTAALSVSIMRWQGGGLGETVAPIVDGAFGLTPRVQLSASVPRAAGGIGTSFFSSKIALYEDARHAFKVAASPTLLLLGQGVVDALDGEPDRVRWGLPVSAEISRGAARLYGGAGYFSPGLWFGGVAVSVGLAPKTTASVGVSRAWRRTDTLDAPLSVRDRKEISGAVAYAWRPAISLFAAIGRTFATLDENGAGTSISGGLSVFFAADARRPSRLTR